MRPFAAAVALAAVSLSAAPALAQSIDLNQDFTAQGRGWSLKSRGLTFTFSRPGQPDVVATAPGSAIAPPKATFPARTAAGRPMTVTFVFKPCSEGAAKGPIQAQVVLGDQGFVGCASPAGR